MKDTIRLSKDDLYKIGKIRENLNNFEHYIFCEAVVEAYITYNNN